MKKAYYREQALERIARDVITAYDPKLYYGPPTAIPIEDIIEAQGLVLEYQYLRNNGRVLGETIFDDGLTAIYDRENHRYDLLPVKGGTILIDRSSVRVVIRIAGMQFSRNSEGRFGAPHCPPENCVR